MLRALDIEAASVSAPLLQAARIISGEDASEMHPTGFLRKPSKWHRHLGTEPEDDHRLWDAAVLFHLRDAFRSGDIWLVHSKRYADLKQALVPVETAKSVPRLAVPFDPEIWIRDRKARMADSLKRPSKVARNGTIPGGTIEGGILHIDRLKHNVPPEADELVLDLYRRLPDVRITDILLDVEGDVGFSDAFTHLRTGVPCTEKIGLLTVLLAEGLNLGLSKMAVAISTHDIPATISEAPYILDGLLMNGAGRNIKEQYADTGGSMRTCSAVRRSA